VQQHLENNLEITIWVLADCIQKRRPLLDTKYNNTEMLFANVGGGSFCTALMLILLPRLRQ